MPSSKSLSNRALILRALSGNSVEIENLSTATDTQVLRDALISDNKEISIGDAGTAMRFLTAFFAQTPAGEHILTGSARMQQRPIGILVTALRQLGANIEYLQKEGFPPLKIAGQPLKGGEIRVDSSISSQFLSALMMIAPKMEHGLKIRLTGNIVSRPYVAMTAKLMRHFGVSLHFDDDFLDIPPQNFVPQALKIESDWTAASYWYEVLSIVQKGEIHLKNLQKESWQGDRIVAEIFEQLGVKTDYLPDGIRIFCEEPANLSHFYYDFTDCPDLTPTLVVTCLLKNIHFSFSGLSTLKIKETDRIAALVAEARKIGFVLKMEGEDTLIWEGETCKTPDVISISPHGDHRIAMAFAATALLFPLEIETPEVVTKSYPNFWNEIQRFKINR